MRSGPAEDSLFSDNIYDELEIEFDPQSRVLWYAMAPRTRPSFTTGMLRDIRRLQSAVKAAFESTPDHHPPPVRYLVLLSSLDDIFNLGGDLRLIGKLVRDRDRIGLEDYARACIDVLYNNVCGLDLPLVTASIVRGHALGGGFEAALSSKLLIAEEQVKFGFPEVLFNLFPGMGAYSLLARRIGPVEAERMIASGKTYRAAELHEMGIVDILAAPGEAESAFNNLVRRRDRRFNSHLGIFKARQRFADVTHDELSDIASIWVDAAMMLRESDLRKIDRLADSQDRQQVV